MDAERFDTLARSLTIDRSRRRVLGLLSGLTLGALAPLLHLADAQAGKGKKKKKKKKRSTPPAATGPTSPPPPPFCASQPDGAACGFCRLCQSGACQADSTQNNAACGNDGTGRCLNGTCNPVPTCSPRNGPCQTAADCCSFGSTLVPTRCRTEGEILPRTCEGRSDAGQPCHDSGHCVSTSICVGYVCQ
jgi:hypothetical protein